MSTRLRVHEYGPSMAASGSSERERGSVPAGEGMLARAVKGPAVPYGPCPKGRAGWAQPCPVKDEPGRASQPCPVTAKPCPVTVNVIVRISRCASALQALLPIRFTSESHPSLQNRINRWASQPCPVRRQAATAPLPWPPPLRRSPSTMSPWVHGGGSE